MLCEACQTECKKFGRTREGYQRHRCRTCRKTYSERPERPLGDLRLPLDRALLCLHLLCEGSSVRAVERITGTEKKAVLRLLVQVGEGCERLLAETVKAVPVKDVQADELWTYIRCKQGTRERRKITDPDAGDAYCYFGIERNSKLVLAWHLGRRNTWDAHDFIVKLSTATAGSFHPRPKGLLHGGELSTQHRRFQRLPQRRRVCLWGAGGLCAGGEAIRQRGRGRGAAVRSAAPDRTGENHRLRVPG